MRLYVFGSSLTSAYWNGAATYYRGLYKNLHALGYHITFAEPDIYDRQRHRDWPADPPFAHCPVYRSRTELQLHLRRARDADLIIKHSGVGADDEFLEAAVLDAAAAAPAGARPRVAFWDVDAPATLAGLEAQPQHPLRRCLPGYDFVFTYGGGPPVVARYRRLGARACFPIYNGLDPDTHFPTAPDPRFQADLTFLGHRLPDRESRVRHFFFAAAALCPQHRFLLAGEGWSEAEGGAQAALPPNLRRAGFIAPPQHNALNSSARLVLNLNRDSMAQTGFSPPTRIFEAAGAGAAILSDAWPGMNLFFEPGREILLATGPQQVAAHLQGLSPEAAAALGRRARERALAEHSYHHRARRVHALLLCPPRPAPALPAAAEVPALSA
ncbi:MAG TPA: glycosyltransferase [Terriglobales bacterium]|nr:glycosyltransferase [Terriglobales bacterium]